MAWFRKVSEITQKISSFGMLRIPSDADQRSEVMAIAIPN
jgi:hypothetical protein